VPLVLPVPLVLLVLLGAPPDVLRDRAGGEPAVVERPAPRDQLEAAPAGPPPPLPLPAPLPLPLPLPALGGRSSGGAVRAPLSVSGMFRFRAMLAALAPRRVPALASPSPSAAGGASGRNRDAYESPAAAVPVPASPAAAAAAAAPAPTPLATPAATDAAWPGLRRAHRAARAPATPGMATLAAVAVFLRKVEPASRRLTSARSVEPSVP
jgi:hypothetical protein